MKQILLGIAAVMTLLACRCGAEPTITLRNNQPFPWKMPVRIHDLATNDGPWLTSNGKSAQKLGGDLIYMADIGASAVQHVTLSPGTVIRRQSNLKIEAENNGVRLACSGHELGWISWGLDLHKPAAGIEDYDADFKPLPLQFRQTAQGLVFDQWQADAVQAGLRIKIELLAYADGFLDINAWLTNVSADPKIKTYAAVVCRWEHPPASSQTLCYDNRRSELGERDRSPFRAGQGRFWFVQRGVDWVRAVCDNGTEIARLNNFAPSFTVLDNSTKNPFHQPRYAGANLSQLGQEIQTVPGRLYSITEIARSNSKAYADRLTEDVLPARGEGVSFSSRLIFTNANFANSQIDQAFVTFTGYNPQETHDDHATVSFGVPFVRFGTSYFPYSTLGENFDGLKLPGMDREGFWPLAADTVLQWHLFAANIRRDLRIAKAMGFQLIRLHHLELLAAIPKETREEYLDFLFGQLRELKLRALIDVYASPVELAELAGRYRDVIDCVELENETLIWGIPLDRPQPWKADYDAIKKVAPEIPVCLTGYNNTGMFDRLEQLGVKFDRVDLHSYIDSVDAMPSGRGYALALGSYATQSGKNPMISEWNWRGLTRMSDAARAKIEASVFETALATRAIPDFYEFQFNETLAPNPRLGRGNLLRHYELLNLSRRPKPEAFAFMKMIQRWCAPDDPARIIQCSHETVELDEHNNGRLSISITNAGDAPLRLRAAVETYGGLQAGLLTNSTFTLAAREAAQLPITVSLTNRVPGFYHVFVRLESDGGFLRYLWAEVRVPGAPKMEGGPTHFDFSKPATVAYSKKATVLVVETACAIGQTLESATGMPVLISEIDNVPKEALSNLVFVGATKDAPPARPGLLVVSGKNSRQVEDAGMELILRYWKFAKDSAARRVGLARKDLPRGGDAAKLP